MVNISIILAILLSFFVTLIIIPKWIKQAKLNGFVGKDMHKKGDKKIAEMGGVPVLLGTSLGILFYIAINTFLFNRTDGSLVSIFALLAVILLSGIVGMLDDFLGWKKGLSKKVRIITILLFAIPLIVINAGTPSISLPIIGSVNLGLIYPLLIIPLGVLGATTTFNFLAGYNGLESKQGIIILFGLAIATYFTGNPWLSVICLIIVAGLSAFYIFNKYPSKIFPGDSLTYPIGAIIAGIAIIGNIERIAILFFIPYIIQFMLKSRGRLKKESFAKINEDESLELPYEKIYGLEHLSIKILKKIKPSQKVYEKDVVRLINGFQIILVIIVLLIYLIP